ALADGGWLLTAAADPVLTGCAPFEAAMTEGGLVYRRPPMPDVVGQDSNLDTTRVKIGILTHELPPAPAEDPAAVVRALRALADARGAEAERACAEALGRHPLSAELHFLHAA